jgi:hypothetical protein
MCYSTGYLGASNGHIWTYCNNSENPHMLEWEARQKDVSAVVASAMLLW